MSETRAQFLIRTLGLAAHPEGGTFREVHRSTHAVRTPQGSERPALTHIYFMLAHGQHSAWHRVAQDELWHFYEGDPVELRWLAPGGATIERREIGALADGREPTAVIPGGCWQTARSLGDHSLAGCTVAPGFDYEDFALMRDVADAAAELRRRFPAEAAYL